VKNEEAQPSGQAKHRMKWITLEVGFAEVLGRTPWCHPLQVGDAGEYDGLVESRFCRPINFRISRYPGAI
jgi:hypothetical protein